MDNKSEMYYNESMLFKCSVCNKICKENPAKIDIILIGVEHKPDHYHTSSPTTFGEPICKQCCKQEIAKIRQREEIKKALDKNN